VILTFQKTGAVNLRIPPHPTLSPFGGEGFERLLTRESDPSPSLRERVG
jgi:hypothetical protein